MSGARGSLSGRSLIVGHLPDLTPEEAKAFYEKAFKLSTTRVRGFYGVSDGSDEADLDVVLFMYNEDNLNPVLKFTCDRKDLVAIYKALGELIRQRFA